MRTTIIAIAITIGLSGCMNLATKPSEITGSYTSNLQYQNYSCDQLGHEVNSLARRENQLVTAQEQRRKSGKVQAFWLGYGTGDGIEAAELANVRGEKEAVRRAMDVNNCGLAQSRANIDAPASSPAMTPSQQPSAAHPSTQDVSGSNWRAWGQSGPATSEKKSLYRCPRADGTIIVSETPAAGCTVIAQ